MLIEIHLDGEWHRCAAVEPAGDGRSVRDPVKVRYEATYAPGHLGATDFRALSVRLPVTLAFATRTHWPSFLVDLLPQGAARERLLATHGQGLSAWELLERGAVNPVGNLRVAPEHATPAHAAPGFRLQEMVERADAFIDHARALGAAVAGATDTQGEAPKFWVVEDEHGQWHPDNGNLAFTPRRHALLKFPLTGAGVEAENILRHEAIYQQVAARCGLRVTQTLAQWLDGALLIPRYDRRIEAGREIRLGVESIYSVCGVIDSATTSLRHDQVLIALAPNVTDFATEFAEYVQRDWLNLALGNRDNHGRNTALLKDTDGSMRLAPIFDFGPSFLDARALARVIHWDGEVPGGGNWQGVLDRLDIRFDEAGLASPRALFRDAAARALAYLPRLPRMLEEAGADRRVIARRTPDIDRLVQGLATLEAA